MIGCGYKRFLKTLANEKRLDIILALEQGAMNVSEIVKATGHEQTVVSHNLRRLEECHFVRVKPKGRERIYSLNEQTIMPLLGLIDKHVKKHCSKICDTKGI